ncbi:hypothetical protein QWZ13_13255 [Reinekea marina]|uniref:Phosphate ABC transporter substrate-binding protein n=1 Tax=Reinekea marina TaxID=1310421 RepID=A0ABV7WQT1_9GAMM|nr:hypothetical protein [Reinekea marina]MDN3649881.1 hypothetical protein [Reinekea marina]
MKLKMKLLKVLSMITLTLGITAGAMADLLVIVHPENNSKIDAKWVKNLYLGKTSEFKDGTDAVPLLLAEDDDLTLVFLKEIVKQKPVQFKRLWSKSLFTGKGSPPQAVANEAEMMSLVMNNPSMVGFIHQDNYTNDVRAVIRVKMAK